MDGFAVPRGTSDERFNLLKSRWQRSRAERELVARRQADAAAYNARLRPAAPDPNLRRVAVITFELDMFRSYDLRGRMIHAHWARCEVERLTLRDGWLVPARED